MRVDGGVAVDLVGSDRPPPGPFGKPRETRPHLGLAGEIGRPEGSLLTALFVGDDRPFHFDGIDDQQWMERIAVVVEEFVGTGVAEPVVTAADEDAATHFERVPGRTPGKIGWQLMP